MTLPEGSMCSNSISFGLKVVPIYGCFGAKVHTTLVHGPLGLRNAAKLNKASHYFRITRPETIQTGKMIQQLSWLARA